MRNVEYRNVHGYVIVRDAQSIVSQATARYVRCPETDGLRTIRFCTCCKLCDGFGRDGVRCKSEKQYIATWYDGRPVVTVRFIDKRYTRLDCDE